MNRILKFIKNNYKIFIVYIIIIIICLFPLPYYIYAPGGLVNLEKRVEVDNSYKSKGSFNMSYVSEYKGNIMTTLAALLKKNWDLVKKKDIVLDNESIKDYNNRDRLMLKESYQNATIIAYRKAKKDIKVLNSYVYVAYLFEDSLTDLKIGDQIIALDNEDISDIKELNNLINKHQVGDNVVLTVKNNNKIFKRTSRLIKYKNKTIIGVGIIELNKLKLNPTIRYKYSQDEYGSSGGLMLALAIYNSLVKKDVTNGKTIVGTGTIDKNGKVGEIDGIKYKIMGAAKKDIDLFIVPKKNYKEAIKIKKQKRYKFKIIGVETFDEIIDYLNNEYDGNSKL